MPAPNKQNSSRTGLAIAEEVSLKVLPGVDGASAVWYEQEPNEYSDFGSDLSLVARTPINAGRQDQKGGVVDLDASAGFQADFTQTNTQRILQGFFFADAREKAKSNPLKGSANPIVSIAANVLTFTNNFATAIPVGALVYMKGFASPLNNGLKVASAGGLKAATLDSSADVAAPIGATAEVCGQQFVAGDVALTLINGVAGMSATAFDFTTLGLTQGEWMFIGGDAAASRFDQRGYARVKSIAAKQLTFDKVSMETFAAESGAGKTVRIFFGTVIRNEKNPALIKRRSYQLERSLGQDSDGQQAEYILGAVANEFTLNIPQADKLNADMTFVALDNAYKTGLEGLKAGARIPSPGESLINTSSNLFQMRVNIVDGTATPTPLFAYATEATLAVTNNVTLDKALGVLGGFDTSEGNFQGSGSATAYFSDVRANRAIRANADFTIHYIFAAANAGFLFDLPLCALSGGQLDVASAEAIKLPLDYTAAECPAGYTLLANFFAYLPAVAMPV